jgi:hypothetical protein
MINYEIKSQLAKLLATEDLVVEHRNVPTACFDVGRRVLTLPLWQKASNTVYDLLVGHEVGHALYTPDQDFPEGLPPQFINVVEDVRIERLMKRRYPGLLKSFYNGYRELVEMDFFEIEDEKLEALNLADRVNLHYKIGPHVNIPIKDGRETEILEQIGDAETFEQVLDAARVLFEYCKEKIEQKTEQPQEVQSQKGDKFEMPSPDVKSGESEIKQQPPEESSTEQQELEVQTDKSLQENLQNLIQPDTLHNVYAENPDVNLEDLVISNSQIHQELTSHFQSQLEPMTTTDHYGQEHVYRANYDPVDLLFQEFKKSAQKEVNYLVKEFECRKSADSYARSAVSRSGVLDCSKLHTYRFNEDLFKKVTVVPDGKNHGLIFILDWSGSMAQCMMDTIKQLYNLIWFCQKVQIPFEVYAFSNVYRYVNYMKFQSVPVDHGDKIENQFVIDDEFALLQFFTSGLKKAELEKQMKNVWRLAYAFDNNVDYVIPGPYHLSGTPLHEALICLHKIIPQFQAKKKVQKVQCVVLTDGEAPPLPVYRSYAYRDSEKMGTVHLRPDHSFLRNRKTGHVYKIPYSFTGFTTVFLKDLRQCFPSVNFIGIRILSSSEMRHFINRYDEDSSGVLLKKARKDKSYVTKNSGYHKYFALLSSSLANDVDFEVDDGASKVQIKSAFAKSLKNKSLNKKVLNQFVELVA